MRKKYDVDFEKFYFRMGIVKGIGGLKMVRKKKKLFNKILRFYFRSTANTMFKEPHCFCKRGLEVNQIW